MTRSRRLQLKAVLVILLGSLAIATSPRSASATSAYCFANCVDAVWVLNCERFQGMYTACDWLSYNCVPPFPVEGYCAWET